MPEEKPARTVPVNAKTMGAGLAALGVAALAAAGLVTITTPGEQECKAELATVQIQAATELGECHVEVADCEARKELLEEAKDACKTALGTLTRRSDP